METLTTDTVLQFSHGYKLLLPFTDLRHDTSTPINGGSDVWRVDIVKPDGSTMQKTTGLTFPNNSVAAIAVPINALDLDRKGIYYYQVVKTTGSVDVKFAVQSFTVVASLPGDLPPP